MSACNHAGIKAVTDGRSCITVKDVDFGVDKVRQSSGSIIRKIKYLVQKRYSSQNSKYL